MVHGGPPQTIRVALSDFRWPLDPALAATRDETTVARALYATPLRTDAAGRVVPGLCTAWDASRDFRTWRFACRDAPAIAAELRRVARLDASPSQWLFAGATRIEAPSPRRLVVRLGLAWRRFPYALTAVAAAPKGVAGPFRIASAAPGRIVARRGATTLVFRRMAPADAVRAFRAGRVDEAPVPVGDRATLAERFDVRARELLGLDVLVFRRRVPVGVRRAYRDTADRGDYQVLFDTSMALGVTGTEPKPDPAAFRHAVKAIPDLPRLAVTIGRTPALAYGLDILYGQWREAGLGPLPVEPSPDVDARFERLLAPYPQREALPAALVLGSDLRGRARVLQSLARVNQGSALAAVDSQVRDAAQAIPIAWVTDAWLVSRRLAGWREDLVGDVDYTRVRTVR